MNYKAGIVSLGCAKNQVDAEMLLYNLKERGFTIVNDPADADAVIVNTCGFIESAKQESIDEIIELGALKREGKIKAIIVTGCLAQRYQNEITKQLYEVDAAIGIGANANIADVVRNALNNKKTELFPDKLEMYLLCHSAYPRWLPQPHNGGYPHRSPSACKQRRKRAERYRSGYHTLRRGHLRQAHAP